MAVTLDYLMVEDSPPASVITLNRPQQLNALSTGLMTELTSELERQAARPEVRAIVLKGAGRAFSAGHRPQGMQGCSLRGEGGFIAGCHKPLPTVPAGPVPVIAAPQRIP